MLSSGIKRENIKPDNKAKTAPPINPSQVFFGEIRSNSLCFPKSIPVVYAPVSFSQMDKKTANKMMGWYPLTNKIKFSSENGKAINICPRIK